ncbi:hypothetical protein [Myxosarcina sp. GI1(2024)]
MRRLENKGIEGVVTLESAPDLAVISSLENSLVREISKPQVKERKHLSVHNHQHRRRHLHNCS